MQILLTFRNTLVKVKMRQFAADGVWRVLYYEEHTWQVAASARKRGAEDRTPIYFGVKPKTRAAPWRYSPRFYLFSTRLRGCYFTTNLVLRMICPFCILTT